MGMRTFIKVKTSNKSVKGSFHARYLAEREQNPEREEPASRPLFTHEQDGLGFRAADRYLAGGEKARPLTNELQHIIVAFNSHDARQLQKLEIAPVHPTVEKDGTEIESAKIDVDNKSANIADSRETESAIFADSRETDPRRARREELKAIHRAQIAHDRPYADAVRKMISNLELSSGLSDLRYVMTVHRHTEMTHVHLLLRREHTDSATGEKKMLNRLPESFLNSRDERGKAKGGLIDVALSDALDTMIPRRQRNDRTDSSAHATQSAREKESRQQDFPDPHDPQIESPELEFLNPARPARKGTSEKKVDKPRPTFVTGRNSSSLRIAPPSTLATNEQSSRDQTPQTPSNHLEIAKQAAGEPAARAANVQLLITNLQPNLHILEIGDAARRNIGGAHDEQLKNKLSIKFAQHSVSGIG